ncbi:LppU/SCO3897 family protein [Nocardia elegans]
MLVVPHLIHRGGHSSPPTVEYPADVYSLSPGDCVNNLNYNSRLNSPTLTKTACSDPSVRMKFVGKYSPTTITKECPKNTESWENRNGDSFCFDYAVRAATCYLAWVRPNDIIAADFWHPHDCQEDVRSGIDLVQSRPQDALYMTAIRIDDVVSSKSGASCNDLQYSNLTDLDKSVEACAMCLDSGCPAL